MGHSGDKNLEQEKHTVYIRKLALHSNIQEQAGLDCDAVTITYGFLSTNLIAMLVLDLYFSSDTVVVLFSSGLFSSDFLQFNILKKKWSRRSGQKYCTSIKNGEKNSEKYLHVYLPNSLGGKILRKEGDSMKDWLHSPPKDDSSLCLGLG